MDRAVYEYVHASSGQGFAFQSAEVRGGYFIVRMVQARKKPLRELTVHEESCLAWGRVQFNRWCRTHTFASGGHSSRPFH